MIRRTFIQRSSILLACFIGLACLFYLYRMPQPTAGTVLVCALISRNLLAPENEQSADLRTALTFLTRTTPFSGHWQINLPPKQGFLNVYLLRDGLDPTRETLPAGGEDLLGNCAYIGAPNLIVCDSRFLKDFARQHGDVPANHNAKDNAKWQAQYQNAFLEWALAHEIGHVVHGDGPAHFREGGMESLVANASVDRRQELEADAFAVQRISTDTNRLQNVISLLTGLLNRQIRTTSSVKPIYGVGLLYNYGTEIAATFAPGGTHPDYIVRCVRLLQLAPADRIDPGLRYEVDQLAARMREIPIRRP